MFAKLSHLTKKVLFIWETANPETIQAFDVETGELDFNGRTLWYEVRTNSLEDMDSFHERYKNQRPRGLSATIKDVPLREAGEYYFIRLS